MERTRSNRNDAVSIRHTRPLRTHIRKGQRRQVSPSLSTTIRWLVEAATTPSSVSCEKELDDPLFACREVIVAFESSTTDLAALSVWDTRSFKRPVSVQENLTSLNPETNIIFSPDERFILTGTAGPKAGIVPGKEVDVRGKPGGRIVVMKKDNLEIVRELSRSKYLFSTYVAVSCVISIFASVRSDC